MSDFDLNQVRRVDGGLLLVFRELLRTRRASAVADRLGLSPSAISHALNRLRDLFDDPLFIRRLKAVAAGVRFGIGHWDEEGAFRALRRGEIDFALGRFGAARQGFTDE